MKNFTHNLRKGHQIFFLSEKIPFNVMAVSERYVVTSRKLHRRADAHLLHFEVRRGAASTFTEAYNYSKDSPVYSIIDFKEKKRAPSNMIMDFLDYFKLKDCKEAIRRLEAGEMELSQRHGTDLDIDWERTNKINLKKK